MKKTLSLLTLSLLLIAAMILGVSAAVTADDIGVYIRFDDQATVNTYSGNANTYARIAFDAERGALRLTTTVPESGKRDANSWLYFGGNFNVADYPYFRMTYEIPSVGVNGQTVCQQSDEYGVHLYVDKGYKWNVIDNNKNAARDTKLIYIKDMTGLGTSIASFRTDMPNNAQPGEYYEYLIYDIALFKTLEAAKTYNPGLEYYYLDMTNPEEYTNWTASQSTVTYDAELGATVFTHNRWIPEENLDKDGKPKSADARISRSKIPDDQLFSAQAYPVYSWKYTSNKETNYQRYILDTSYTVQDGKFVECGLGSGVATNATFAAPVVGEWNIGYVDFTAKITAKNIVSIAKHYMDPINTTSAEGGEYVAWKYIGYFKSVEAAMKGVTPEPENLAVVPATTAGGTATITGVDSTMEYTTDIAAGTYTAVEGDSIAATPGTIYYVRYAETETANASNPVAVSVPHYINLKLTAVKDANGKVIDTTIDYTEDGIVVNVPFGTNTKALIVTWSLETSAAGSSASLFINGDSDENKVALLPSNAVDFTAFTDEDGDILTLYYNKALCEYYNAKIVVEGADKTDAELAQLILESVAGSNVGEYDLMGIANADAAYDAIYNVADIAGFVESFTGSAIDVDVTEFEAATKGTANDIDGTDGYATYKYTVTYGEATVESEPITVTVPAQHFRVLWKFNTQEFADKWFYSASNVVKTENKELPVVTKDGETFGHIELTGANNSGVYIEYGIAGVDNAAIYNGAEYNSFFKAEDYPYTVVYYRSTGALPQTSAENATHIYWSTDTIVKGNDYDYAPVPEGMESNPGTVSNLDLTKNPGGKYLGYMWSRNLALWGTSFTTFPQSNDWNKVVIANNGGTDGVSYAGSGYKDGNYMDGNVVYPWSGDLLYWRLDVHKIASITEGTFDIMAVAFFSNLEDAQNFDLSVADPFTADEKADLDTFEIEAADGLVINTEALAIEDITAKIAAAFDFDDVQVAALSYAPVDALNGVDGYVTVEVTVASGTTMGDIDYYTTEKTMVISAPAYTAAKAVEAIEITTIPATASLYDITAARAYVSKAIAGVFESFNDYSFSFVDEEFVAPVDGESEGYYTFKIEVANGDDVATTDEISFAIEKSVAPVVYSFANDMIFSLTGKHHHSTKYLKDDETALGGKVFGMNRDVEDGKTSAEFNMTISPGSNGMDAIVDLSEYPVVVYRYKTDLVMGDKNYNNSLGNNQIYWYTDGYATGHAYMNISPANAGETFPIGEWYTRIIDTNTISKYFSGTVNGDVSWNNNLKQIRFDFHRAFQTDVNVEVDYIGFFANVAQAEAFIANPTIKGTEEELEKYAADLIKVNANANAIISSADIVDDSALATARQYVAALGLEYAGEAYCAVTEYVAAVDGYYGEIEVTDEETGETTVTEGVVAPVNGKIVFNVVFSENGISNAIAVSSEKVIIAIDAADYKLPVVKIGEVEYLSLEEAIAAAVSGDTLVLIDNIELTADVTLPAGIKLNGNDKSITGATVWAGGDLEFIGHTTISTFNAGYDKPVITIGEGACLEMTTGRMVIGHGATFNITGTITDAKTADTTALTPSLIIPGASFTGKGVNFNVTNAYVKFTAYCSSKNSSANGTFNINVTNSVWEQAGSLTFSLPTNGMDPTVNFKLTNSVLNTASHLVFSIAKGEIVIDNSLVNNGTSKQLENRSSMTIKNGSVVHAAVATNENAKNPGSLTVDNATFVASGELTGADVGIGTLVLKNNASVTLGNISKTNVTTDTTSLLTANKVLTDVTFTVDATALNVEESAKVIDLTNNASIEEIVTINGEKITPTYGEDGDVTVEKKAIAKVGDVKYASFEEALAAITDNCTITLLDNITLTERLDVATNVTLNLGGKNITSTVDDSFGAIYVKKGATLTIEGEGNITSAGLTIGTYGTVNVNGGNITTESEDDASLYVFFYNSDFRGTATINGGALGTIWNCGNLTVNGGTVEYLDTSSELTVSGGTITEIFAQDGSDADGAYEITITDPSAITVPEGFELKEIEAGKYQVVKVSYVAEIDGVQYETLQAAFAAVPENATATITLIDNFTIEGAKEGVIVINGNRDITLDLNGKTITVVDNATACFSLFYIGDTDAKMTVKDSAENGTISLTATTNREFKASSSIFLNRGATLVIESGSYIHNGGSDMAYVVDNSANSFGDATTTINGGTLRSTYTTIRNRMEAKGLNGTAPNGNGVATLTVNGGSIDGTVSAIWGQASSSTANNPAEGTINILGGDIGTINVARNSTAKAMLNVSGGTVANIKAEQGEVKISGGTVTGTLTILTAEGNAVESDKIITGGTFNSDLSAYLAHGYKLFENKNGTFDAEMYLEDVADADGDGAVTVSDAIKLLQYLATMK